MAQPSKILTDDDAELYALDDLIGYNLKRAYVIAHNDYREALGEGRLAPRVFAALSLVIQFPNITQSELARLLGIERSGLVAIVDSLEADNFVVRQAVPGDRRVQALVPLPAGQAAYDKAIIKVKEHEERLMAHLSTEERATLLTLLKKVRQHEEAEDGWFPGKVIQQP